MSLHFQPQEKKGPHVTVRFPHSVHATITRLAEEHHTTVTEVVRALVRAGLERTAAHEAPSSHGAETPHGRPPRQTTSREGSDAGT
jgi:Arc/MetJ-type ribon-helix-helix transcriptional regulator